ncbi:MAG: HD domain-containing protein [Candidatus Omnitrophica bacterium]|nr:HD domain-containing protein [Candidatus Omnitrophota bacterium]
MQGQKGNILLIHDSPTISLYLKEELRKQGYSLTQESDANVALDILKENNFDLVIMKFNMAQIPGLELLKTIKKINTDVVITVIFEETDPAFRDEVLTLGAYEVFTKPINLQNLTFVIKKGVQLHSLLQSHRHFQKTLQEQNMTLSKQNTLLSKRIEEATRNLSRLYDDLRSTYMRTIRALAHAIDARDHYTHRHSENVTKYAVAIAQELGLGIREIDLIRQACELHDLGKIGIRDGVLNKPGPLTKEERIEVQKHPLLAVQILEPLSFLGDVIDLVKHHHEQCDGKGYPDGLKGEQIPLGARILHLADAYDAMRSERPYRGALPKREVLYELKKNSGTQFDTRVVEAFLKVVDKIDAG